ncbi:phage/plasmid replication protein [Parapedobacter sp. 2B3]|uniref:phage/plasmid replication domain-containing protein n=1 Tax=Parapedobacter sp. 2B3 TaxID=3342381 RepID=UPI0035B60C46
MIDTVHFRIKNLNKYNAIVNQLSTTSKKGHTEIEVSRSMAETKEASGIRSVLFHDYDNIMPITRRSDIFIPSSHYSVSYSVNYHRDFIDFNLSLPKYQFGTNILQAINYYDTDFKATYYVVINFFDDFFKKVLIHTPDFQDVEVRRIDLCYNQFFVDKAQALSYLDKQKGLAAKYARSSKNNYRSYDTSLMYVTGRYSFKIYHKGTEFEKHDKRQIYKAGNPKGYDVDNLQYQADRILRYEMTFRNTMLNYIFKQDIVKKNEPHDFNTLAKMARLKYGRRFNQYVDDYLSKTLSFTLKSKWQDIKGAKRYEDYFNEYDLPFDSHLFKHVYNRFWQKVKDYQLNIRMSIHDVMKKIDENELINETKNTLRKKRKANPQKTRLITLAMLSQYMDIANLKSVIDERTLYRYKADLKKLGINMYNANDDIPPPPIDYQEYKFYFGKWHQSVDNKIYLQDNTMLPNKNFYG